MSTVLDYYEDRWTPEPNTGCKIWTGTLVKGYPQVRVGGKKFYVTRLVCAETHGPIGNMEACHKRHCGVGSACVAEDHLYPGTRSQNERDKDPVYRKELSIKMRGAMKPHGQR